MGAIDVHGFAKAIRAARKHVGESQSGFGERFDVGRQTVARWEDGLAFPSGATRGVILEEMGDLPPEVRIEIAVAFGAERPAPPPARREAAAPALAPVTAAHAVDARGVMEGIVFRAAEELDLGPGGVRRALVNALVEIDRNGIGLVAAIDALRARVREAASPA